MKCLKLFGIQHDFAVIDKRIFKKGDELRLCGESYEGNELRSKTLTVQGTFLLGVGGFWNNGYVPARITIKDKYTHKLYMFRASSLYSIHRVDGEERYLKDCTNMMSEDALEKFNPTGMRFKVQLFDEF